MSTERIDMKVYVDATDAMKKAAEAWRAVARLANPQLSEEDMKKAQASVLRKAALETERDETDT